MEPSYQQTVTLSDFHVDCFRRLKPSVLLYLVQDISGTHAASLGFSWEALAEKNLFWALIRHRVRIHRLPTAGETITLETWPMPTTRTAYPRATVAHDENGQLLFESHALWILMDLSTRQMVLPGKSGVEVPGNSRPLGLDAPKAVAPREYPQQQDHFVGYTLLDRNGHMNNTYYLNWTEDLLESDFHKGHPLKELNICYLAEAREGQKIRLNWQKTQDDTLHVEAKTLSDAPHRVFAIVAEYGNLSGI